jgi:hypothetical protein
MKHFCGVTVTALGSWVHNLGLCTARIRIFVIAVYRFIRARAFDLFPQKCIRDRWTGEKECPGSIENNHKNASEIAGKHEKMPTHVGRQVLVHIHVGREYSLMSKFTTSRSK